MHNEKNLECFFKKSRDFDKVKKGFLYTAFVEGGHLLLFASYEHSFSVKVSLSACSFLLQY